MPSISARAPGYPPNYVHFGPNWNGSIGNNPNSHFYPDPKTARMAIEGNDVTLSSDINPEDERVLQGVTLRVPKIDLSKLEKWIHPVAKPVMGPEEEPPAPPPPPWVQDKPPVAFNPDMPYKGGRSLSMPVGVREGGELEYKPFTQLKPSGPPRPMPAFDNSDSEAYKHPLVALREKPDREDAMFFQNRLSSMMAAGTPERQARTKEILQGISKDLENKMENKTRLDLAEAMSGGRRDVAQINADAKIGSAVIGSDSKRYEVDKKTGAWVDIATGKNASAERVAELNAKSRENVADKNNSSDLAITKLKGDYEKYAVDNKYGAGNPLIALNVDKQAMEIANKEGLKPGTPEHSARVRNIKANVSGGFSEATPLEKLQRDKEKDRRFQEILSNLNGNMDPEFVRTTLGTLQQADPAKTPFDQSTMDLLYHEIAAKTGRPVEAIRSQIENNNEVWKDWNNRGLLSRLYGGVFGSTIGAPVTIPRAMYRRHMFPWQE